jgi:filamentous hemagglutinin
VIKRIDDCDGFKKGDYVVVDAMHKDHLEVFDKNEKWIAVANFDGTKNEKKTEQGREEPRRPLEKKG